MKPLILIIEDDAQIRRFLRAALAAEGYRMQETTTAEEGLAQAQARQPDLILLDLGLPDRDGRELLARIRAGLRRSSARADGPGSVVRFGLVEVDLDKRVVRVDAQAVHLTPNEYKLLQVLIQHAGKVLTQRQLLNEVWGPQHTEQAQYLRVYIAQLRRKLERNPARPKHLQTEPGVGYRLVTEDPA